MALERLQKIISKSGFCSRRSAEILIKNGRVSIDGVTVSKLGVKADPDKNKICIDGKPIYEEKKLYLLFYKPEKVITSMKDPEGRPIVSDYINIKERVYPVGRLDFDAEGLLLLTNDGEFANKIIHPKHKIKKTYRVKTNHIPDNSSLELIRKGISYRNIHYQPATIHILRHNKNTCWLELTISEGKNHEVKNMMSAIGLCVLRLVRTKIGNLSLEGLKKGEFRKLSKTEIMNLTKSLF